MINWEQFSTEAEAVEHIKAEKHISAAEARQYIRRNLQRESYYQDKIMKHIKALVPSAFVWKEAQGAYSRQGIPDVSAVINGRYYGFEVKRPLIGVLSKIQEQTIKRIWQAGGRAYVVTYASEVTEILRAKGEIERMEQEDGK